MAAVKTLYSTVRIKNSCRDRNKKLLPIRMHIFVASARYESFVAASSPSATDSGPSPPPLADMPSTHRFISSSELVNSWTRVINERSCGGWSRYSIRASLVLNAVLEIVSAMFRTCRCVFLMYEPIEPVQSTMKAKSTFWWSCLAAQRSMFWLWDVKQQAK